MSIEKPSMDNDYASMRYKIELIPESDGSWGAVIPDLPGCVGAGDTVAEALEMLEDAKLGWLSSHVKHGDPMPEPTIAHDAA